MLLFLYWYNANKISQVWRLRELVKQYHELASQEIAVLECADPEPKEVSTPTEAIKSVEVSKPVEVSKSTTINKRDEVNEPSEISKPKVCTFTVDLFVLSIAHILNITLGFAKPKENQGDDEEDELAEKEEY